MKKITPFIQLVCKHNYFNDGLLQNAIIQADAQTNHLMQNNGIFVKFVSNGFTLGYDEQKLDLLSNLNELKLTFYLQVQDPLFYNQSDLPNYSPSLKILQLTNVDTNNTDGEQILLHHEAYVQAKDVVDRDDVEIRDQQVTACINITLDQDQLVALKTSNLLNYEIRFNNRKLKWYYYIIDSSNDEQTHYTIHDDQSKYSFTEATKTVMVNGQTAWLMKSKDTIGLKEQNNFLFDLTIDKGGQKKSIKLPSANSSKISLDQDGETYVSIYVYI